MKAFLFTPRMSFFGLALFVFAYSFYVSSDLPWYVGVVVGWLVPEIDDRMQRRFA